MTNENSITNDEGDVKICQGTQLWRGYSRLHWGV